MSFRTILVLLALIVTAQAFPGVPMWGLADVTILNSIHKHILVDVQFVDGCGCDQTHDLGDAQPGYTWTARDSGDCLITKVSASTMLHGTNPNPNITNTALWRSGECQPFRGSAKGSFSIARAFAVVKDATTRKGCKVVQLRAPYLGA